MKVSVSQMVASLLAAERQRKAHPPGALAGAAEGGGAAFIRAHTEGRRARFVNLAPIRQSRPCISGARFEYMSICPLFACSGNARHVPSQVRQRAEALLTSGLITQNDGPASDAILLRLTHPSAPVTKAFAQRLDATVKTIQGRLTRYEAALALQKQIQPPAAYHSVPNREGRWGRLQRHHAPPHPPQRPGLHSPLRL